MTDPISPAEAAAAAAIDSVNAENAAQSASGTTNSDLLDAEPTDAEIAAATQHAHELEARLAAIRAKKAAALTQGIPHATPHVVPAVLVPSATDKPVVHAAPAALPAASPEPIKPSGSFSAQIQARLAAGWVPKKYVPPSKRAK